MAETKKKKKTYIVKVQVDMCAQAVETVICKTTKPHLASRIAEGECYKAGHFHAKTISCKEMT